MTEALATRRSKRSTAGNRMEAALAEIALEQVSAEEDNEEDRDFVGQDDEDEVFDSDFQSTDDEATENAAPDNDAENEDKVARKVARQRLERATNAAHVRQRATFNPNETHTELKPSTVRRRVSLAANLVDAGESSNANSKRMSRRRSTILNSQVLHSRLRDAKEKKAAIPKRLKESTRALTQMELIAKALDNEEGNILEHRDYLSQEEEKRKRAKVTRQVVAGPVLRWVSKAEEVQVKVPLPLTVSGYSAPPPSSGTMSYQSSSALAGQYFMPPFYGQFSSPSAPPQSNSANSSSLLIPASVSAPSQLTASSSNSTVGSNVGFTYQMYTYPQALRPVAPPQATQTRKEKVARQYLIHELDQMDKVPKPKWNDTMEAVFGNHVRWEDVKAYMGKNRPLSRPVMICPITGRPARVLSDLKGHRHFWDEKTGSYMGMENLPSPMEAVDLPAVV